MNLVRVALLFLFGVCVFQSSRTMPSIPSMVLLAILLVFYLRLRLWSLSIFLLAYLWSAVFAFWILTPGLANQDVNRPIRSLLCVLEVASNSPEYVRFLANVEEYKNHTASLPKKALISWYKPLFKPETGQCFQATVKFKPPHGYASVGAFNRETWYYLHGIGARGTLQGRFGVQPINGISDENVSVFKRLNKHVSLHFRKSLQDSPYLPLLTGLATGNRSDLQAQHWQVLQRTGTSHLLAISGLHIGAIALVCYFFVLCLWKRSARLCQRIPAQRMAALFAFGGALVFAMLSGFAVPAQRAIIMLAVFTMAMWLRRPIVPSQLLAIACLIILILNPRQVLTTGFWFSFIAVTVIILSVYFSSRSNRIGWFLKLQLILSSSAFAITLYYFGQASILMPLANLIAVPVVSFVLLPILLVTLGMVFLLPRWAEWPLMLADSVMHYLWEWLQELAEMDWAILHWRPALYGVVLFHLAVILVFMLRGWKDRWLALVFASALFVPAHRPLSPGQFKASFLDVGQGLAVVIQTAKHVLVYDTGPRYGEDFDTSKAVVIPYLRANHQSVVDLLVISHNDVDHRGGAQSLLQEYTVNEIVGSQEIASLAVSQKRCASAQLWRWDGVEFAFLHPQAQQSYNRNNGSCVLKVSSQYGDLLLTGDIERQAEHELLSKSAHLLESDVMLVPHHGSQTSSSQQFLKAVAPKLAINSAGFLNQYGFPHPFIRKRYTHQRIPLLNTAELGTIELLFATVNQLPVIRAHREQHDRYWHWTYLRQYH